MSGSNNKPFPKYKCPVCGAISDGHKRVGDSMMRCMFCNVTDSNSQFKPIDEDNPIASALNAPYGRAMGNPDDPYVPEPDIYARMAERIYTEKGAATYSAALTSEKQADGTETFFEAKLDDKTIMRQFYPPQHVVEAVAVIEEYFTRDRGAKEWAYGPIQSRDVATHPALASVGLTGYIGKDIRIEDVRRLAAAFQCIVVKHPSVAARAQLVDAVLAYLDKGNKDGQHDAKEIVDNVLLAVGL